MTAHHSPLTTHRSLLIVGGSARAAAHSALRAGMTPVAIDLFADRDLVRVARTLPVGRWPGDVRRVAREAPPGPWMYTGALENHPRVVAAVAAERPLWGNAAAVLRRVRDPLRVYAALSEAGLPALEVRTANHPPTADGSWLLKPRRGAGGYGIRRWTAAAMSAGAPREPHYFQRRASGVPISAVYVGGARETQPPDRGTPRQAERVDDSADFVGVSQQFIGLPSLGCGPFAWCGAIGPLTLPDAAARQIERTGQGIGRRFGLRGLFGIDFVLCDDGVAWPTEVNPRYTASVEVLEHALAIPLLDRHRRACTPADGLAGGLAAGTLRPPASAPQLVAKAILYAPRDVQVPPLGALESADPIRTMPPYADLPHDGETISQGRPISSVLASGGCRAECLDLLGERLARLRSHLGLASVGQIGQELAAECLV